MSIKIKGISRKYLTSLDCCGVNMSKLLL